MQNEQHPITQQRQRVLENFILFCLSLTLVFDTLNGALIKYGIYIPVSALYKFGLLVLMYGFLVTTTKKYAGISIITALIVLFWALLRFAFVDNIAFMFVFQESIKVLFLFVTIFTIASFEYLSYKKLAVVFFLCTFILIINVLLTYAGLGGFSYGNFGAKGFLFGGNVVAGIILCCVSFFLALAFKRSSLLFLLVAFFYLLLAFIMGTKSATLGVFLVAILLPIFRFDTRTLLLLVIVITVLMVITAIFYDDILSSQILTRVVYFYDQGGLSRALFSGREDKFAYLLNAFSAQDVPQLLFGFDQAELQRLAFQRVEFDFADMVLYFGGVFTVIVYSGLFTVFLIILRTNNSPLKHSAIVSFIVMFFISSIAGHVIFNGIVAPVWGLMIGAAMGFAHDNTKQNSVS
ncbi:MAG: hypothetical protein ACFHVJ_03740 [Aestuariibacter sp.]